VTIAITMELLDTVDVSALRASRKQESQRESHFVIDLREVLLLMHLIDINASAAALRMGVIKTKGWLHY